MRIFFRLNFRYGLAALIFFVIEVFIALFVRDNFIRPYFGDYLVVFLLYYLLRSFIDISVLPAVICVLLFSYLIETLQYFRFVDRIGWADNLIAKTIIGYGFSWWDMLAYTLGALTILIIEKRSSRVKIRNQD